MKYARADKLKTVLEAVMLKDQSALAKANAKVERIKEELATLELEIARVVIDPSDPFSQGQAAKHRKWVDGKKAKLMITLAAAMADRGMVEAELKTSFGRHHAFSRVVAQKMTK
ncbi:hypothetical protein [Litoreibacter roseus]|uniref:Uncharacterized protein n=1 Tax=Litoreibacter roseus TaxID=2601869 RepID=A0A6N6JDX0_9RHOB|nr:hypothetical protein [Litoreibacter roseus]GFE64406.1 hypothetical protein KIN_14800 [Litoreibacter roseus]